MGEVLGRSWRVLGCMWPSCSDFRLAVEANNNIDFRKFVNYICEIIVVNTNGHPCLSSGFLGASWSSGDLRRSWDYLGTSGGDFGAVSGPLRVVSWDRWAQFNFLGIDIGPIVRHNRHPKGIQNRSQDDPKSNTKFNRKKKAFETLLDLSWAELGSILGSKNNIFQWFYSGFVNITC